jgi:hypothetical protein
MLIQISEIFVFDLVLNYTYDITKSTQEKGMHTVNVKTKLAIKKIGIN